MTAGGWRVEAAATAEIDLATTRIGWTAADRVLKPAALRVELRLGAAEKKIEPLPDASTSTGTPNTKR
jgi:hypothetical protein